MANNEEYDSWFDDQVLKGAEEAAVRSGGPASSKETKDSTKVMFKHADGSMVDVDSLNMPPSLKSLLKVVDADDDGILDEVNVRDALKMISSIKDLFGSKGHLSHSEVENGLALLKRLVKEKEMNSSEVSYMHMPERVQDVMKEWDLDRSGSVSVVELSAAAHAHKKVKQEGRTMRRIIVGLSMVIILLLTGTFILSYMAVDLAKEMRGDSSGTMKNGNGEVVKVDSASFEVQSDGTVTTRNGSCPANTTCRPPVLQMAASKPGKALASTLPDDVFKNLEEVTLKGDNGKFIKLKIEGVKRVQTRSSKCGSIVKLTTQAGTLTIDDTSLSADDQLAAALEEAQMPSISGELGLFGRRLSASFLEGFFTMLEDMEWECTSVPLPSPKDLPSNYLAKMQVTELITGPPDDMGSNIWSQWEFTGQKTFKRLRPGVFIDAGGAYKTWTEEVLVFPNLRVAAKEFPLYPMQRKLDITKGEARASIDQTGETGYHCMLEATPVTMSLGKLVTQASNLRLVGLTQEAGLMLRQWRMDVGTDTMADEFSKIMISEYGFLGNVTLDYYDVDTDPTGKFQPGQPFRIQAFSTPAYSGAFNITAQYTEITPVDEMDVVGALNYFNVKKLSAPCEIGPMRALAASNASADQSLVQAIEQLDVVASPKVPHIDPWGPEGYDLLKWTSDEIAAAMSTGTMKRDLTGYWREVLTSYFFQESSFSKVVVDGPTEIEMHPLFIGGLNLSFSVQYSNSTNSLPGGIKSIKASAKNSIIFHQTGLRLEGIDLEAEIMEDSRRADGYAKDCMTQRINGTRIGTKTEGPALIVMCLTEEFDYMHFTMQLVEDYLKPDSTFAAVSFFKRFAMTESKPETPRVLCNICPHTNLTWFTLST